MGAEDFGWVAKKSSRVKDLMRNQEYVFQTFCNICKPCKDKSLIFINNYILKTINVDYEIAGLRQGQSFLFGVAADPIAPLPCSSAHAFTIFFSNFSFIVNFKSFF